MLLIISVNISYYNDHRYTGEYENYKWINMHIYANKTLKSQCNECFSKKI